MENVTLKISDYLSDAEIKEIVIDEFRNSIKNICSSEKNIQRILSNLSYEIIFNEIDKVIPNSREVVVSKTKDVLKDIKSYSVFRDASYGGTKSLAYLYMEEAVKENKQLFSEKIKETIINKDYSEEIWNKFEDLADNFMGNIYEITRLGREKKDK